MFRFSVILFFARLRINACWSKCFRYFFSYSFMVRLAFLRWWYIIRGVNVLLFFLCLFWCLHHFLTFAAVSPPGLPCWNLNLPTRGCVGKILPRFPARKQGRFETPFPFPMVSSKPFRFYAGVFDCGLFFWFSLTLLLGGVFLRLFLLAFQRTLFSSGWCHFLRKSNHPKCYLILDFLGFLVWFLFLNIVFDSKIVRFFKLFFQNDIFKLLEIPSFWWTFMMALKYGSLRRLEPRNAAWPSFGPELESLLDLSCGWKNWGLFFQAQLGRALAGRGAAKEAVCLEEYFIWFCE